MYRQAYARKNAAELTMPAFIAFIKNSSVKAGNKV